MQQFNPKTQVLLSVKEYQSDDKLNEKMAGLKLQFLLQTIKDYHKTNFYIIQNKNKNRT